MSVSRSTRLHASTIAPALVGAATLGLLAFASPAANAQYSSAIFTGDVDSRISSSKTYTHAVNLNGGNLTINSVLFTGTTTGMGNDAKSGDAFSLSFGSTFTGNTDNLTGNINTLGTTFFYGDASETLMLSGLKVGTSYLATFYNVGFGDPGTRIINLSDSLGHTLNNYDENEAGSENGDLLFDAYTATSTSATFTFQQASADGGTFHAYGFSNEVVPSAAAPEPGAVALMGAFLLPVAGLVVRRTRRDEAA